jgi:hypothetical protein
VVGLDDDELRLKESRAQVPGASFSLMSFEGWDGIPRRQFDVILLSRDLSGLSDPREFIPLLMGLLSPRGVVVFDWPVVDEDGPQFLAADDGERDGGLVAQFSAVRSVCVAAGWRFRRVGVLSRYASQHAHQIYHLGLGVKDFFLLLGESTTGKSTKARSLLNIPGAFLVGGDSVLFSIKYRSRDCTPALKEVVLRSQDSLSYPNWAAAYSAIAEAGLEGDFLDVALEGSDEGSIPILDAYFPQSHHDQLATAISRRGYNPVRLVWEHPLPLIDEDLSARQIADFHASKQAPRN